MTIASCLTRLSAARDAIISAINGKGGSATGHGFEDFATDIAAIPTGGGSSWTLLTTKEYTVSTTSTTATTVDTIALGSSYFTSSKILYVKVRDKAGIRNGYFVGSDTFFFNVNAANSSTSTYSTGARLITRKTTSGTFSLYFSSTQGAGVYGWSIDTSGNLIIQQKYSSNYSLTINSTYVVEVYTLDYAPNQGNPFDYSYPTS